MKLPRITIVTPSYNQGDFIRETLESIIGQGYPHLELFVVDGGSSDQSVEIIREYGNRIDWWVSEKDQGQSDAINKGFKRATGELLCWVNSDDVLFPGCLDRVGRHYVEKGKPDIVHANSAFIDERGIIRRLYRLPRGTHFFLMRGVWMTPPPAVFFKAAVLKKAGYLDNQYRFCMDLDIWMRILSTGGRVALIPKYLGAFRWYPGSKTYHAKMKNRDRRSEPPEVRKIFERTLSHSTEGRRWLWRRLWKVYQVFNLNYIFSFAETRRVRGKHWKKIFSG